MEKVRTELQKMTAQGVQTGEIKYPRPTLNVLAVLEEECGRLETMTDPTVKQVRLMIYLLEMQKIGKEEEVEKMTSEERKLGAAKLVKEKNINVENITEYNRAANAAFMPARRPKKKEKK